MKITPIIKVLYSFLPKKVVKYMINWNTSETIEVYRFLKKEISDNYYYLKLILNDNKLIGKDDDETVINILRWVKANIKYESDEIAYKTTEYWAHVIETIRNGVGDCEDGAILVFCLCRAADISPERVFIAAGDVDGGGHCWVRYISENWPYVLFFIDWCYYPSLKPIKSRIGYMEDKNRIIQPVNSPYIKYWFIANDKGGFKW
jgi:hypothetical protein